MHDVLTIPRFRATSCAAVNIAGFDLFRDTHSRHQSLGLDI